METSCRKADSQFPEDELVRVENGNLIIGKPKPDQHTLADGGSSPVNTYIEQIIDGTSLTVEQERGLMDQKLK